MPTANYDASLLTRQRRDFTIFTWNKNNQVLVNQGQSILREQPNTQLATVVTYRHQALANNTAPGGCQCEATTLRNSGGDRSQNWG
jgi:hypothetical protein